MKRILGCGVLFCGAGLAGFAQAGDGSRFLAADVHVSEKARMQGMRSVTRGERPEWRQATIVDLIRFAYAMDPNRIVGGPSWLEMNRYDVFAKVPPGTTPDAQKEMLKALLAERFKLVVRNETQPVPAYVLTAGKKPQLKEADGTGETGCKPQSAGAGVQGPRLMVPGTGGGSPTPITLGPGGAIEFKCRNMTMAAFAEGLRGMLGSSLGANPVQDQTGLAGKWNFDVHWSMGFLPPGGGVGERITVFDALEKQLGLKLEDKPVPTPVLVVVSVNEKPGDNPPGTAEALPPLNSPKEFEVATVKPTSPDFRGGRFQVQPGGRLVAEGMPFRFLLSRAFNTNGNEQLTGLPSWVDSTRFDVVAKIPDDSGPVLGVDPELLAPMMRKLLEDRFKMKYHTEERQVNAYTLVAGKPKLKKADPASRTWCKNPVQVVGAPPPTPGEQSLMCQNTTMAQFAERLQGFAPGLEWPVLDQTGLEGGWDFTVSFSMLASMNLPANMRGPEGGQTGIAASDPNGGYTIFEAMEKQLGLKLEKQKRAGQVIVIDHLEQTPTDE